MVVSADGIPPRLLGIAEAGRLGSGREAEAQQQIFRETVLRPGWRRLEQALAVLLEEISPGSRVWFYEMDITNLADDATFFEKMIRARVYTLEEAWQVLDRLQA